MTYRQARVRAEEVLSAAGIPDHKHDAQELLFACTGMNLTSWLMRQTEEMTPEEEGMYQDLVQRRAAHVPLQHITGHVEFMGLDLIAAPGALIPRQDTEVLAGEGMAFLKAREAAGYAPDTLRIADVCTGSGCLAVSLQHHFPGPSYEACDISDAALRVAAENIRHTHAEVQLHKGDLLEALEGSFDLIISNPPYIPAHVIDTLDTEVKAHDPRLALDGGEDGLDIYRRLIPQAAKRLRPGGRLLLEIGYDQGRSVPQLMHLAGFQNVFVQKDLAGLDRVVGGDHV